MEITQPFIVKHYNQIMGGVDRMDHNVETYRISIRSRKWWWPLFAFVWMSVSSRHGTCTQHQQLRPNHWIFLLPGVPWPGSTLPVPHKRLRLAAQEDLSWPKIREFFQGFDMTGLTTLFNTAEMWFLWGKKSLPHCKKCQGRVNDK